jgi:protein-tyrosine-phosphatase
VFLCTGNAARSVIAGAALSALLPERPVHTAGTLVVEGQPMSWRTRAALESELVIALAPEHVHWVRRTHPAASPRTGTLRRLVRDLAHDDTPLSERVAALRLHEIEPEDWEEVIDPGGGEAEDFAACARDVHALIGALAARLAHR